MKDIKQGVSKFTEKDLTPNSAHSFTEGSDIGPLETHVQSELEKIQAGHEGYKVVPVELWKELKLALTVHAELLLHEGYPSTSNNAIKLLAKLKSL